LAVVGQDRPALEPICEEVGAHYFDMSLHGVCAGIASVFTSAEAQSSDAIQLPTASGAPRQLAPEDYPWISEDLEIVHLFAGLQGDESPRHFRLGSIVSWRNLQLGHDCTRDLTAPIRVQVEDDLRRRDTVRINLYHAPGGGGSTVARRIVWDLHDRFPVVVLLECEPRLTAERIARIGALTENGVLVLVDGGKHSDRDIDELFEQLKAQQTRAVLLQALRRFQPPREGLRRQFWVPADLTDMEGDRFRHALVSEAPLATLALSHLASKSGRTRSPFFFGLTAFGRDFRALPSYVGTRLADLTDAQRRIIAFVCFAYYYGQQSIPAQCFAAMLSLPSARPVILAKMFRESSAAALELLVEDPVGEWRSAHHEVALESLKQILAPPSADDRAAVWRQSLSSWSKDFATFIRTEAAIPSERLLELARRVFVYRDNTELLGTERVAGGVFSQLIEDIPSPQGRIDVLGHVCERFPDEAHFHAHLGRLLGAQGDFERAIDEVDRALELSDDDHVLHHMRGMILRSQVRSRFEARDTVSDIIPLVINAQTSFAAARELRPDNEHGYVSEIQLLLQFLDAAAAQHRSQVQVYIGSPSTPAFCRIALEQAETLIDRVSHLYVGETPSRYIMDCRARMQRIYGDYAAALRSLDNLINRSDVAKPPIRRQIVWTILRRHDGQWAKLSNREVDRARALLEENLLEETRDSTSLRLWLRAVRLSTAKPSLDSVIERVAYWKLNTGSLDAVYYLYVLHSLRAMEGSAQAVADMERALEECRSLARYRRDRTRSLEWIGPGSGVAKLVHQSQLGDWQGDFFKFPELLASVEGRVKSIDGPQKGVIAVTGGLEAFFVPARSDIHAGRDENVLVNCYIGFSYDGLRAWAVMRR
jgi:tetratricopeptide (TPR) repeat protein